MNECRKKRLIGIKTESEFVSIAGTILNNPGDADSTATVSGTFNLDLAFKRFKCSRTAERSMQ